jgi:hypothetical protein
VKPQLAIFLRGFTIVALTATNVGQVAGQHWVGAFMVGFAISFVWFANSRCAARTDAVGARECYALGAACGTVAGMLAVKVVYG